MKTSIKKELAQHVLDRINDGVINDTDRNDWHFHCFNEDYYMVYHSTAREWLKHHNLDAFEAIDTVREYEVDNFGRMSTDTNPESIVNTLAYIYGEELIYSVDAGTIDELKKAMEEIVG
jgi:hypothetical protein